MKKMIERVSKIDIRLLAIGSAVVLVVLMIPLLVLGGYANPCADDFSYTFGVRRVWLESHSLWEVFKAAGHEVKNSYYSWQGTFSSIFLMALCPISWGEEWYVLVPILMLGSIVFSHFLLFYIVMVKGLRQSMWNWCFVSSVFCAWIILSMHSPVNMLYWYNGAVHYTFMHSAMISMIAFLVAFYLEKSKRKRVMWALLVLVGCVLSGGGNYATALLGLLCVVGVVAFAVLLRRRISVGEVVFAACYGLVFLVNISAGGNNVRQEYFDGQGPLEAVISSFDVLRLFVPQWMNLQAWIFLLLLLPVMWSVAGRLSFKCRVPGLVTALSICYIACSFTPLFYAMGGAGVDRHTNIVKMWFQLLLVFNLVYWFGWVQQKGLKFSLPHYTLYYVVVGLLLVGHFYTTDNILKEYSSYAAYVSIAAGEAKTFHREYEERMEIIADASQEDVVQLKPYSVKPYMLFFDDITGDIYDWRNRAMAEWYQRAGIYISE